jgi:hypothetical protein
MVGKAEQHVCIKLCVKLGKSDIETLEIILEVLGKHFFKPDSGFFNGIHVSRPVEC